MAELINENSDWLSAVGKERDFNNIPDLANMEELRTYTIVNGTEWNMTDAMFGLIPVRQSYSGTRAIMSLATSINGWITLDPSIKTMEDFVGKDIGMYPVGSTNEAISRQVLQKLGIYDKVNLHYGWDSSLIGSLQDRVLDVITLSANSSNMGETWAQDPGYTEVVTRNEWYSVNFSEDILFELAEDTGYPIWPVTVPAGSLPNQTVDWAGHGFNIGWWVDKSIDPAIVEEILRIIYENIDKHAENYTGLPGYSREAMGYLFLDEGYWHESARQFYRENGIETGYTVEQAWD